MTCEFGPTQVDKQTSTTSIYSVFITVSNISGLLVYTVTQKTSKIIFVITTSNFHQIGQFLIGTKMANCLKLYEVHSVSCLSFLPNMPTAQAPTGGHHGVSVTVCPFLRPLYQNPEAVGITVPTLLSSNSTSERKFLSVYVSVMCI